MHRRSLASCAVVLAALICTAPDARAQSLLERYLVGKACYARAYDAAHLESHPRQTVTHFFLQRAKMEAAGSQPPDHFPVSFGFRVKASSDLYASMAECRAKGSRTECWIEGDGGHFTLAPDGPGLRVTVARMEVEGAKSFSKDLARGDNRVMLLHPSPGTACPGS